MGLKMATSPDDIFLPLRQVQRRLDEVESHLNNGDGGGTYDGMEARVNRLEERLDRLIDRTGSVEVNLATMSERISHLPSKTYIDTRLAGMLAAIAALIAFGDKIQSLLS
ncbi:hypothetical protein [Croceicoccus sp. BE223]|uniref:hypothetical protein n=1 Tax=Croceicoccus sp. BE223 TaxID=2817716 RepID=UPI0028595CE8|nr:hypothetical protein [Croceicoccus sp. BE223]MDR7102965.1 hypothetical protein [Croceicoccus sp. BE223]